MTLDTFSKKIQKEKELFTSWSNVKGKTRATVLTIFEVSDIIEITSILTEDEKKKKLDLRRKYDNIEKFPEIYQSAMSELGNILASNYVSSLGDLLDIRLMTQPPDMIIDTAKKLFKYLRDQIGFLEKLSLIITTSVIITDIKIEGAFILVPEIETLHQLLNALEQFYE
jgi:chemotaxis protein CheY-P-specific phosphatase CheC